MTINNFSEFYKKEQISLGEKSARKIFDFCGYLSKFNIQQQEFIKEFIGTQMFVNFIEEAYEKSVYLKKCVKIILEQGYENLIKKQTKEISNVLNKMLNPKIMKVEELFEKYLQENNILMENGEKIIGNGLQKKCFIKSPSVMSLSRKSPPFIINSQRNNKQTIINSNPFVKNDFQRNSEPPHINKRITKVSFIDLRPEIHNSLLESENKSPNIFKNEQILLNNRSNSVLTQTDKQLFYTITQLQKISNLSNTSNRTTTDSIENQRKSENKNTQNLQKIKPGCAIIGNFYKRPKTQIKTCRPKINQNTDAPLFEIINEKIIKSPTFIGKSSIKKVENSMKSQKQNSKSVSKMRVKPPISMPAKRQNRPPLKIKLVNDCIEKVSNSYKKSTLKQNYSFVSCKHKEMSAIKMSQKIGKNKGDEDLDLIIS